MILQFKVKNFLSIREEQTLDFTASADKTYEDYAVVKIKRCSHFQIGCCLRTKCIWQEQHPQSFGLVHFLFGCKLFQETWYRHRTDTIHDG